MTPTSWHSLYLCCTDPHADSTQALISDTLRAGLTTAGYMQYDPFGLMPGGKAYPRTVKTFVSPGIQGWSRIILAPDTPIPDSVLSDLAAKLGDAVRVFLALSLMDSQAQIRVFTPDGGMIADAAGVAQAIATCPNIDSQRLQQAFAGTFIVTGTHTPSIPLDVLGGQVGELAQGVNVSQAQGLFDKVAGRLLKRDDQNAAQALLNAQVDWNSAGGQQIQAVMACLPLRTWREPDFVTLRDAYQLHNRRRRNPNAQLYPGDAEALAKVPDALAYSPVFAGRSSDE